MSCGHGEHHAQGEHDCGCGGGGQHHHMHHEGRCEGESHEAHHGHECDCDCHDQGRRERRHNNGSCCQGGGQRFQRRFQTREERIAELEEYRGALQAESKAVEEMLVHLKNES